MFFFNLLLQKNFVVLDSEKLDNINGTIILFLNKLKIKFIVGVTHK